MKFKINDIEYCKRNSDCDRSNGYAGWSCKEFCEDKFSSFEKNYSKTVDLTRTDKELTEDITGYWSDEYYYDKELKINIMPLKRYNEYKESFEKFTFLYLVRKYIKQSDIFKDDEDDIRDYIIKKLDDYDENTTNQTISYEDIIYVLMDFNDYIPSEIIEDILISAISKKFTDKIKIKNTKLNIVNKNTINDKIKKIIELSKRMPDIGFNFENDDWHSCSGCKYHNYNFGRNNCSLGNYCDDYDEENQCMDYE